MLQAGHSDIVLVDTLDELPSLADVQLAHLRLRALCLPGEINFDLLFSPLGLLTLTWFTLLPIIDEYPFSPMILSFILNSHLPQTH